MIQMPGKRVRTVPVLILPEVKLAMDALLKARNQHGLFPDNPFFFATTLSDGHLEGCRVMRTIISAANLQQGHLMTSTNLRKYVATVSQVITLKFIF